MAMDLNAKAAYIRGLMTGMEFDPNSKNGKIIAAMMDLLEAMADTVTEHDQALDQAFDELDAIDEDLDDLTDASLAPTTRTTPTPTMTPSMKSPAPTAALSPPWTRTLCSTRNWSAPTAAQPLTSSWPPKKGKSPILPPKNKSLPLQRPGPAFCGRAGALLLVMKRGKNDAANSTTDFARSGGGPVPVVCGGVRVPYPAPGGGAAAASRGHPATMDLVPCGRCLPGGGSALAGGVLGGGPGAVPGPEPRGCPGNPVFRQHRRPPLHRPGPIRLRGGGGLPRTVPDDRLFPPVPGAAAAAEPLRRAELVRAGPGGTGAAVRRGGGQPVSGAGRAVRPSPGPVGAGLHGGGAGLPVFLRAHDRKSVPAALHRLCAAAGTPALDPVRAGGPAGCPDPRPGRAAVRHRPHLAHRPGLLPHARPPDPGRCWPWPGRRRGWGCISP